MKKQILIPTVALFIICLVATTLLALANNVTAPIIEKNSAESEAQSRMEVLADAKSFEDKTLNGISSLLSMKARSRESKFSQSATLRVSA